VWERELSGRDQTVKRYYLIWNAYEETAGRTSYNKRTAKDGDLRLVRYERRPDSRSSSRRPSSLPHTRGGVFSTILGGPKKKKYHIKLILKKGIFGISDTRTPTR